MEGKKKCRVCGCTDGNCRQCIERTGRPCYWVEDDLCSACAEAVSNIHIGHRSDALNVMDQVLAHDNLDQWEVVIALMAIRDAMKREII